MALVAAAGTLPTLWRSAKRPTSKDARCLRAIRREGKLPCMARLAGSRKVRPRRGRRAMNLFGIGRSESEQDRFARLFMARLKRRGVTERPSYDPKVFSVRVGDRGTT